MMAMTSLWKLKRIRHTEFYSGWEGSGFTPPARGSEKNKEINLQNNLCYLHKSKLLDFIFLNLIVMMPAIKTHLMEAKQCIVTWRHCLQKLCYRDVVDDGNQHYWTENEWRQQEVGMLTLKVGGDHEGVDQVCDWHTLLFRRERFLCKGFEDGALAAGTVTRVTLV